MITILARPEKTSLNDDMGATYKIDIQCLAAPKGCLPSSAKQEQEQKEGLERYLMNAVIDFLRKEKNAHGVCAYNYDNMSITIISEKSQKDR